MDITAIWKPEYSVGHPEIDTQHKYLFELWILLASITKQPENRRSLEQALLSLYDYVEIHFQREEELLAAHPDIEKHKEIHAAFVEQVQSFMDQFRAGTLESPVVVEYLKEWLIDHIVETDIRYFRALDRESS